MTQANRRDTAGRADVVRLLSQRLGKDISYDDFRVELEDLYNFRLAPDALSEDEFRAIEHLFDTVAYYSPFPREREEVPFYKDEAQVDAAVEKARRVFEPGPAN